MGRDKIKPVSKTLTFRAISERAEIINLFKCSPANFLLLLKRARQMLADRDVQILELPVCDQANVFRDYDVATLTHTSK